MIVGIGIDLASIPRTRRLIERFGERFTRRAFTEAERDYCESRRDPAASYAARFAAKEAMMKSLSSGWGSGVRFIEIEVVDAKSGGPSLTLAGGAKRRAEEMGIGQTWLSLTHEADVAAAVVVAESDAHDMAVGRINHG